MITYADQVRITKEVILGIEPKSKDDAAQAAFRASVVRDKAKADKAGQMLTFPTEWDGGFD